MAGAVIGMLVAPVVLLGLGWLLTRGQLARNALVGIRIRSTLASDEAWARGHAAAAPSLVVGGLASLVPVGIFALTGPRGGEEHMSGLAVGAVCAYVAVITFTALASVWCAHVAAAAADTAT